MFCCELNPKYRKIYDYVCSIFKNWLRKKTTSGSAGIPLWAAARERHSAHKEKPDLSSQWRAPWHLFACDHLHTDTCVIDVLGRVI